MAFKMNRPIIKGTPFHEASIAKAKPKSIVSQSRTTTDASLVKGGQLLGESYMPAVIDFSINREKPKFTKDEIIKALKTPKKRKLNIKKKVKKKEREEKEKNIVREEIITLDDLKNANENAKKGDDIPVTGDGDNVKGKKGKKKGKKKKVYIEEPVDADDADFSAIENDNSGTDNTGAGDGSSDGVNRGYKNFKRREEERMLAEAEALKAKMDAESRARAANNPPSKITPKNIKTLPNNTKELELNTADKLPESNKAVPAHLDKNLNREEPKANREFPNLNLTLDPDVHSEYYASLGIDPRNNPSGSFSAQYDDYEYTRVVDEDGVEHDMWSYKNQPITDDQVGDDVYEAIMNDVATRQEEEYNAELEQQELQNQKIIEEKEKALNSNTPALPPPSNSETLVQPQPKVESNDNNTEVAEIPEKPRVNDFEGSFFEKQKQYREAMKVYKEKYDTKYGKSPVEMRDDRVYRLSKPDGVVRKNMIKSGYKPQ